MFKSWEILLFQTFSLVTKLSLSLMWRIRMIIVTFAWPFFKPKIMTNRCQPSLWQGRVKTNVKGGPKQGHGEVKARPRYGQVNKSTSQLQFDGFWHNWNSQSFGKILKTRWFTAFFVCRANKWNFFENIFFLLKTLISRSNLNGLSSSFLQTSIFF